MPWTIEFHPGVLEEDAPRLGHAALKQIKRAVEGKLAVDPLSFGKPLRYSLQGQRALRVGDWRVIYVIHPDRNAVMVVHIGHRKDIYERALSHRQ